MVADVQSDEAAAAMTVAVTTIMAKTAIGMSCAMLRQENAKCVVKREK